VISIEDPCMEEMIRRERELERERESKGWKLRMIEKKENKNKKYEILGKKDWKQEFKHVNSILAVNCHLRVFGVSCCEIQFGRSMIGWYDSLQQHKRE